jgi:hypothetical protein
MAQMAKIPLPAIAKGLNKQLKGEFIKPDECVEVLGFHMYKGVWRKDFKLTLKTLSLAATLALIANVPGCLSTE